MVSRPTFDDVCAAHDRIRPVVHRTPVMTCATLDEMAGHRLFFKCEQLQRVGAFKFRGASNVVLGLTDDEASRGVCTHSSGNHAQALARAARERGIPAWIVMPTSAPAVKRAAVEGYGATIVDCVPTLEARESTAAEVLDQTGALFVHPYDDDRIIAGQATAAKELIEDVPDLDVVMAPIGGGGLMSGSCISTAAMLPEAILFGAEPEGADDAARSLASGKLIPQTSPDTICDGLLTSLSERTWSILRDHLTAIVTVGDDAVRAAQQLLLERAKLWVEPSSATVLAAVLKETSAVPQGSRIGLILSGGNAEMPRA
ncbi:MAG: pyridoxal-phosphate dependent enzyme [Phycisphaerales bacterium]|nr:pyridoxal-phosphate dependent enzyme [Phycisphaerales bacterium]